MKKRSTILGSLSLRACMLICLLCLLFILGIIFGALSLSHLWAYSILIALPVACIAYFFQPRTTYVSVTVLIVIVTLMIVVTDCNVFSPWMTAGPFFCMVALLYIEAYGISVLRSTQDTVDRMRRQSDVMEQQLTGAYRHEQHLNALKDQFLLNLSHEMRTPLTEVKGYINLLLETGETAESDVRMAFLQNAAQGCDELELLVNNVLDASRFESDVKPPVIEDIVLHEVVTDLLEYINMQEHQYHLNVPTDIVVQADRQQLRQILRNLLSNACKYSPVQTTISIEACVEKDHGDADPYAQISIGDEGPGIAAEDIPTLFQKFARLKCDQEGSVRGTGLGLYICRKFVEGMGGRIWVESTGIAKRGSQFYFTLPLTNKLSRNADTGPGTFFSMNYM